MRNSNVREPVKPGSAVPGPRQSASLVQCLRQIGYEVFGVFEAH
jgi:hypothetical protein